MADDDRLMAHEKFEEELGSVDHDVWVCSACLSVEKERYITDARWTTCPSCYVRAFREERTVSLPATTVSEGEVRVDGRCAHCKFMTNRRERIPKIVEYSGSGGGSWGGSGGGGGGGGGSSGGGGASRGW